MAVDFGILAQTPTIGARYAEGLQLAQAEQERNMLRAAQMQQMRMQQENMLAQREERAALTQQRGQQTAKLKVDAERAAQRQQFLSGLGAKMAEGGYKLDRPTLGQMLQFGMQTGEDSLIKLATEGMRALDEEEVYAREATRFGLPGAAAPTAAPANALAVPAAPAGVTRDTVQNMMMSPSARIREQGKALVQTLEKPEKPYEPSELQKTLADLKLAVPGSREAQALEARARILTTREPKEAKEPALRTQQVTMSDGTLGIMNMDTGQVTPASLGGASVKGKPSAFAEKTEVQRKQLSIDLDRAITELKDVSKKGGLIDQSTGSGAGRGVDIAAGFFGKATPGAIAIGKLAPIADMVLKMVPRFEGPQSDKDTRSYKEAAGQLADATLPTDTRKAAAIQIVRLMEARKNQFVTQEMAAEGAGAAPRTSATGVDTSNPLLK